MTLSDAAVDENNNRTLVLEQRRKGGSCGMSVSVVSRMDGSRNLNHFTKGKRLV